MTETLLVYYTNHGKEGRPENIVRISLTHWGFAQQSADLPDCLRSIASVLFTVHVSLIVKSETVQLYMRIKWNNIVRIMIATITVTLTILAATDQFRVAAVEKEKKKEDFTA